MTVKEVRKLYATDVANASGADPRASFHSTPACVPEVLHGSNGVLVESEAQSIATAIRNLLPNPNRRRDFGEAALRTVERNYTWAARLPQLYSIYGLAE